MDRMIELGGRNYALRYTVNSLCAVEARAGGPLESVLKYDFAAVRLLLWGGLIEERPELTLREAGDLMEAYMRAGGALDALVDECAAALREAGFFGPAEREAAADFSATPGDR